MTATKGEEFLAGAVYFGVVDNHVILVQSRGLRTLDTEKYLNWFLVQKTKVLPEDNRVALADHTPKKKKGWFEDVRGIEIEAPVHLQPIINVGPGKGAKGGIADKSLSLQLGGKAWEAVRAIFGDGFDLPTELKVDDVAHAPQVEVKVMLSWRGTKNEDDHDFLGAIAKNMSHVDDEFGYTVHTRTGKIGKDTLVQDSVLNRRKN